MRKVICGRHSRGQSGYVTALALFVLGLLAAIGIAVVDKPVPNIGGSSTHATSGGVAPTVVLK